MTSFNCKTETFSNEHSTLNGGGTLKIDKKSNQYTLKIKSGLVNGKFRGEFKKSSVQNAELLSLAAVNDTKNRYILTDGDFAFANVEGNNFLEGLLYFANKDGAKFVLFVKGVFKRGLHQMVDLTNNTRWSHQEADKKLFGCFSFEATDTAL